MERCGKCGCEVPPGTGTIKRIDVGSVGGQPVRADRLVCDACAATITSAEKGCFMSLLYLAGAIGIFWIGLSAYFYFFTDR